MSLQHWVYVFGGVYLALLALAARASWRRHRSADEFMSPVATSACGSAC